MALEATQAYDPELDQFIQAYETAQAGTGHADLAAFLPQRNHPLYHSVLRELVRVDLEYTWERGHRKRLEEYEQSFPELFEDPESLHDVAFEEYRLRQQVGDNPSPAEYERRFGINTADWPVLCRAVNGLLEQAAEPTAQERGANRPDELPHDTLLGEAGLAYQELLQRRAGQASEALALSGNGFTGSGEHAEVFEELHRLDPKAAQRLAQAVTGMPRVGSTFLGFQLLAELGRGAFGRVFLARQRELANRFVVVKIAPELGGESQTLAQLQHTHIVPIYSLHRSGPFQAVCMPYFGATTLADVLKDLGGSESLPTSGKGFVDTVEARRATTRQVVEGGGWKIEDRGSNPPLPSAELPSSVFHPPSAIFSAAAGNLNALAGRTYVETVLWMAARLADGLAHAHERGILHRDLKPANILLTDDGQPMLLDFNLSTDMKLRTSASAARIGGTLAYMAPEHLEAFHGGKRPVDARSDLYAFGVILYELLSRRTPFEKLNGPLKTVLPRMIAARLQPLPDVRRLNRAVSPAVASIVRRCLEPEPGRRYQAARELREDLQRQLDHRPLRYAPEPSLRERARKWRQRHPRLTSSTSVAVVAAVLLAGLSSLLVVRHREQTRLEALTSMHQLGEELKSVRFLLSPPDAEREQRTEGIAKGRQILDRYRVLETPTWLEGALVRALPAEDSQRLRDDMGELLLLLARGQARQAEAAPSQALRQDQIAFALRLNTLAEGCYAKDDQPRALWRQRAELTQMAGDAEAVRRLREQADAIPVSKARDRYLPLADHLERSELRSALAFVRDACRNEPNNFAWWLMLGVCQAALGQSVEAAASYSLGISLEPQAHWAYFNRGVLYLEQQRNYQQARDDFDEFIKLKPDVPQAYFNRAVANDRLGDLAAALADLNHLVDEGEAPLRAYFLRANVRAKKGDPQGASQDRQEALRRKPTDDRDWVVRGLARLPKDPKAAVADFDEALELNPRSRSALQNKASVFAEHLGRTEEAISLLDKAVALYPDYVRARSGRGVLLARLGRRDAAHADATESLRRDPDPLTLYQVAGIYALTSRQNADDRREAFRLLGTALRRGFGYEELDRDRDLDPIRDQPEFRRLVDAARMLRGGVAPKTEKR